MISRASGNIKQSAGGSCLVRAGMTKERHSNRKTSRVRKVGSAETLQASVPTMPTFSITDFASLDNPSLERLTDLLDKTGLRGYSAVISGWSEQRFRLLEHFHIH